MHKSSFARTAAALVAACVGVSLDGAEVPLLNHTFTLPEGFEIELAAGPPLVERPMMADFDEQGRLYVADSSGSNDPVAEQLEDQPHRIVRLEDTDGDGRFDRSVVFADRMMFPEGVLYHDGAVYSGAPPSIWRLRDTNGDGVADERVEWHQGRTLTGCANDLHGPYLGPDGWIYWCKGAFAEQTHVRPGHRTISDRAAHVFRCRPDGSGFDSVMSGGMDNPVEVAFGPEGEVFFITTFFHQPALGLRDAIVHCVYGGVYPKVHGVLDTLQRTGELLPPLVELGPAAACGLTRYQSTGLGAAYQNNLFSTLFNLRKIMRHVLVPVGGTYASRNEDFLVSDNRDFHPTDVLEDADGSLLVIDTGGWYKLCCPSSQLAKPDVLGAIYRIRRIGAGRPADPRGLRLDWPNLDSKALVALLDDPRPAVRQRAIEGLGRQGSGALTALSAMLREGSVIARRNAVWALTRIEGAGAREAVRLALEDSDPGVQQAGLHSVAMHRDASALPRLVSLVTSPNPAIERKAAEALGRLENPAAVPALLAAAGDLRQALPTLLECENAGIDPAAVERVQEHALIYALIEIADPVATRAGLATGNPAIHRAALVALDQMDGARLEVEQVAPLLASADPLLRETADWIALHHPEWGGALAGFFRGRLAQTNLTGVERDELLRQLARFAGDLAVQECLAEAASNEALPRFNRTLALAAMGDANLQDFPASWLAAITGCLAVSDDDLVDAALNSLRQLPAPKEKAGPLTAAMLALARNPVVPAARRIEALRALPSPLGRLEPDLFALLLAHLTPRVAPGVRSGAAAVLAQAGLDHNQWLALADALREVGPMELNVLLEGFERVTDEAVGLRMVAALQGAGVLASARVDLLQRRLAQFPPAVQQAGSALLRELDVDPAAQAERLEKLLAELHELRGDARRGQAVFNSPQTACATCHALGYLGGKVGPDLTTVGQIRSERDLLESILYPSASFVRSYEPVRVFTKDDEDYSGILANETESELWIVTGADTTVRVAKSNVSEVRPGTVSTMPGGLAEQLSRQEAADLLAFLSGTRWGAR